MNHPRVDSVPSDDGPTAAPGGAVAALSLRLDGLPLTRLHIVLVAICTLGLFTDVAEVILSNALAVIFVAPPHNVPRGGLSLSLLLASVFAGGAVGAPVFGLIGDRFGRRRALQASLVLMAVGSLAAALSPDLTSLIVARAVSGLAIGGYPPLVATVFADVMPPRRRGAMLLLCLGIAYFGGVGVLFLIQVLTPMPPLGIEPWRWALILGTVLALLGVVLFGLVPESPRWLASVGRTAEADRACRRFEAAAGIIAPAASAAATPAPARSPSVGLRALRAAPDQMRRMTLFVGLYALSPWATSSFILLSAAVMVEKGFRVDQSLVFAGLSMLGPPLGSLVTALIIDRVERRACLLWLAGTMAVLGTVFAASTTFVVLVLTGIAFNMASAIYGGVMAIYATELLSTALRASAFAVAFAGSRVSAALVPIVLLPVLALNGPHAMFAVITATLVISIGVLLAAPRGRSGETVA